MIRVKAYIIFCLPSTLVFSNRRMYWKFVFSPDTSAVKCAIEIPWSAIRPSYILDRELDGFRKTQSTIESCTWGRYGTYT